MEAELATLSNRSKNDDFSLDLCHSTAAYIDAALDHAVSLANYCRVRQCCVLQGYSPHAPRSKCTHNNKTSITWCFMNWVCRGVSAQVPVCTA
jgi:hypothetical protein